MLSLATKMYNIKWYETKSRYYYQQLFGIFVIDYLRYQSIIRTGIILL